MDEFGENYAPYKVILIGDISVGKTSITTRLCKDIFLNVYQNTVAGSFMTYKTRFKERTYALHIWDTSGEERYRSILPMYLRGASAAIIVYDITKKRTFDLLEYWLDVLLKYAPEDIVVVIVGNKTDLHHERAVTTKIGKDFAAMRHHLFFETSAKTGANVTELFKSIVEKLKWRPISDVPEKESLVKIDSVSTEFPRRRCCLLK